MGKVFSKQNYFPELTIGDTLRELGHVELITEYRDKNLLNQCAKMV